MSPQAARKPALNKNIGIVKQAETRPSRAFKERIEAIDLARGFAIALMILSHGVKGLISFDDYPTWGLVPIHLVTKFSSSLFILVFGVCLAVAYMPHVGTARWSEKRKGLLIRGLTILFWYKVLTVVEMFHLYSREDIINALLYKSFPVYVEILGFYGIALLWVPFALSLWRVLPLAVRILVPVGLAYACHWLTLNFDFFGVPQIQALLVEHDDYYTWGQLSRAPLIFLGMLVGELILYLRVRKPTFGILSASHLLIGTGVALFASFLWVAWPGVYEALHAIALNKGKHPPELAFMLFSLAGAFFVFGLAVLGGNLWAKRLKLITTLGNDAMGAFIFHACVLFVGYRFLCDYWLKVSYGKALMLALAMIVMTSMWIKVKQWAR